MKTWKHDLELYIETIGASWSGVTSLLRHCRLHDESVFDEKAIPAIIKLATAIEKRPPALDSFLFRFDEKGDALHKLVMLTLPVDLATEFRQTGGESNGFELFRKLTQKLEPARSDNSFHLANEIRGSGGVGACKNFEQPVRFVKFLNLKMKDYLFETGEVFPDGDAARVLSGTLDEDTLTKIDDGTDFKLTTYDPV